MCIVQLEFLPYHIEPVGLKLFTGVTNVYVGVEEQKVLV